MELSKLEWKEFFIEDIAEIISGRDIYEAERTQGTIPYITATAQNNGIGYYVGNNNLSLESNCLSVNRNGSVGYSFFHPYEALFSNDCRKLRLKVSNKYIGLFISNLITRQREKYGYGYKMGTARLKRQKILLPVNAKGKPDYAFMENYMRKKEEEMITKYKAHISLKISRLEWGGVDFKIKRQWKEFSITKIFDDIQRGKRLKKNDHCIGAIPYASATAANNWIFRTIVYHLFRSKPYHLFRGKVYHFERVFQV